jgi:hypothetical protein
MNFSSDTKTVRFQDLDCVVELRGYANGRPALVLTHEGEQVAVATLNMPEIPLGPDRVIIKDYSENAGMMRALVEGGIITDTNVKAAGGFPIAVLLPGLQARTMADAPPSPGARADDGDGVVTPEEWLTLKGEWTHDYGLRRMEDRGISYEDEAARLPGQAVEGGSGEGRAVGQESQREVTPADLADGMGTSSRLDRGRTQSQKPGLKL